MIKRFSLASALALAALAVTVFVAGCGQSIEKGSVAVAGDDQITQQEFNHWYQIAAKSQQPPGGKKKKQPKVPKPTSPEGKQLKDQVLQFLINAAWIRQEADEDDVAVSKKDVDKEFKKTKKQFFKKAKDYNKFLKSSGMSEDDVLTRVELQLLSNKIREKVTKDQQEDVSDDDIKKYYKKNKQQFETPETRDLTNVVQTKSKAKAEQALKALESGQSAKQVAKKFSKDQASKKTGKLAGVTKGQFGKDFDKKVFKAQKGKLIGPFKTQFGYYVVEVEKITPGKTTPIKKAEPQIKNILKSQNQQEALQKFITEFQKKWKDRTECKKGYIVQECKNAPKPKTTAPTGPGGTPPPQGGGQAPPPQGGGQAPPPQGGGQAPPPSGGQAPPPSGGQ